MHSNQHLYSELTTTLTAIEKQIKAIADEVEAKFELGRLLTKNPYEVMDANGRNVLTDLLLAKATCLNAMATLKATQIADRKK